MKESRAIIDWKKCVNIAKKKFGISPQSYGVISGKVLQTAQRCYCAMGY